MEKLIEYTKAAVPDFLDVEVHAYEEQKGETINTIIQIRAESNGETYGGEVAFGDDDDLEPGIVQMMIVNMISRLVESAAEDGIDRKI